MPRRLFRLLLLVVFVLLVGCTAAPSGVRPGATPSPAATATAVPTATATSTPTPRPAPTATSTPTPRPTPKTGAIPPGVPPAPRATGRVILVSLSRQWLYTYQDGAFVFANAVETGMPELATPSGTFSILSKSRNVTFTSPWPEGSPYHYEPTNVNYALEFLRGGFFLHDAWWHVVFGPGGNVPHRLSDGRWETGSHGCVGMTIPDAKRLYEWSWVGMPVIIVP